MGNWILSPCFQLLIVSIYALSVTCYEDTSKYYNGRPDPIGIDFGATYAAAVYANSESNFTFLGLASGISENGNNYAQYIEALHWQEMNFGSPSIIIDDSPRSESDAWDMRVRNWLSSWYLQVRRKACRALQPLVSTKSFHQICCSNNANWSQGPRSKYRRLVSQYERTLQLNRLIPKYFRPSTTPQPLTISEFVFLIYQLLLDLKSQAQKERGVSIASAVIGIPPWIPHHLRKLFEEAAFLAGIGTFYSQFDGPHTRVEMAVKTGLQSSHRVNKSVMILDHGQYHLSAHHFVTNEWNVSSQRFSSRAFEFGTRWVWATLGNRLIEGFNSNVTREEKVSQGVTSANELQKIVDGRRHIKYSTDWPDGLEFANRSIGVNMTELSGRTRLFNMTGADVEEIDEQYTANIADLVQYLPLRHEVMREYFQTRPDWENISKLSDHERWKLSLDVAVKVSPPADTRSWFHTVDEFIILDDGWEIKLLDEAARKGLAWRDKVRNNEMGICIPTIEIAARGAALYAIKLIDLYEERMRDMQAHLERQEKILRMQGWDGEKGQRSFLHNKLLEYYGI